MSGYGQYGNPAYGPAGGRPDLQSGYQDTLSTSSGGQGYQYLFKFIIIGDEAVGKTCLLLQFTDKRYRTTHQVTVGVEFGSRTMDIAGRAVKLQCWDTAGQDRFRSIIRSYYRGAAGALLVYDITRRESFLHIAEWLHEARQNADPDLVVTLVGNKCDQVMARQVSFEDGRNFANQMGIFFIETSAVTGQGVDEAFTMTAHHVLRKQVAAAPPEAYDRFGTPAASRAHNEYLPSGVSQSQRSTLRLAGERGQQSPTASSSSETSCCG